MTRQAREQLLEAGTSNVIYVLGELNCSMKGRASDRVSDLDTLFKHVAILEATSTSSENTGGWAGVSPTRDRSVTSLRPTSALRPSGEQR